MTQKQTRATNSLLITQHHREIWTTIYQTEQLERVFDKNANILEKPITEQERAFVNMIFLHMSACLKLEKFKSCLEIQGMEADIIDILSFPVPNAVWLQVYKFHDKEFREFVNNVYK